MGSGLGPRGWAAQLEAPLEELRFQSRRITVVWLPPVVSCSINENNLVYFAGLGYSVLMFWWGEWEGREGNLLLMPAFSPWSGLSNYSLDKIANITFQSPSCREGLCF